MTWELAEDAGEAFGYVALFTGHPDTLQKNHAKVLLHRAATYQRGSFPRRALSWLQYWIQAFIWLWRWPKDIPVLLFSNPPILCWLGWLMRTLRGQRYAVMIHDIYPDVLVRFGGFSERHPLIRAWRWLNRHAYERAAVVMTLGQHMAQNLERQFDARKTPAGHIEVIYPWVDTEKIRPLSKKKNWFAHEHGQVDKLTMMYSGNMGLGHDIETILAAAEQLQDEPDIHFMFIGAGPKRQLVSDLLNRKAPGNVTLMGWQAEDVLPFSLATADVALVSLEDGMDGLVVPSKAFSSLAAGAALIALAGAETELADIINQFDCGWVIHPHQVDDLVMAVRQLRAQPARLAAAKERSRLAAEKIGVRSNSAQLLGSLKHVRT